MNDFIECTLIQSMSGIATNHLLLSPEDYLFCESVEEVAEAIESDLADSIDCGDVFSQVIESELNVPEEFYIKWKKLKEKCTK